MTIYVQYELRCDVGLPDDPFQCEPPIYAVRREQALAEARRAGWQLGKTALCPEHKNQGDTSR